MNAAVTWALAFAGGTVLYMGVTGQDLRAELAAVLTGDPNPPPPPPLFDQAGAQGFTAPGGAFSLPGSTAGGGSGGSVAVVDVAGHPGQQLAAGPAAAFAAAERLAGRRIPLTGTFRTYDEQAALRIKNGCPDVDVSPSSSCDVPTARPGSSRHELGEAIDVEMPTAKEAWVVSALTRTGWARWSPSREPWHWSWGGAPG